MTKDQLLIYPSFATRHIQIPVLGQEEIKIAISNSTQPFHIHCNAAFEIKTTDQQKNICIYPKTNQTNHSHSITEIYNENIEIFIKIPQISWKPTFVLQKCSSILSCSAVIVNQSHFSYPIRDIQLIFRSIDHKYKKQKDERDIPSIDSSNYISYELQDKLNPDFVLDEHLSILLWAHKIEMQEQVEVNLEMQKPKYLHSFLNLKVPELMLPGELEIIYRLKNGSLLNLGTVYNKIQYKDHQLKIMFPMNKSIKVLNTIETKNHSFFIEKTTCKLESKITKFYDHPILVVYFSNRPIKSSSIPYEQVDDCFIWKKLLDKKEEIFVLEYCY